MEIVFVPLYIKYLGMEAFGLIGIFSLLQAWLSLLDAGMTPALSREMARFTGGKHSPQSIRNLLRSIEIIAITIAVCVAVLIFLGGEWLTSNWLKTDKLSDVVVANALALMGVIIALRFVENIYRSSLVGLQKQVAVNVISSLMATLRSVGSLGILIWVSPSIESFFMWQCVVSILTLIPFIILVYIGLPKAKYRGEFSVSSLKKIWRYAGGMLLITFLSLLLTQVDKILLSKLLLLKEFGYYSLAALVAGGLYILVNPVGQAFFPRFSELVVLKDETRLIATYHKGAQLVSVIMGSVAVIIVFFTEQILYLWTQDIQLTQKIVPIVIPLVIGNFLNGLMWIPYQAQLAHGWTSLTIKINSISVLIIIPLIVWLAPIYGAEGVAWIWVFLNMIYVLVGVQFMFKNILLGEKWRWYWKDVLLPVLAAIVIAALLSLVLPKNEAYFIQVLWLFLASILVFFSSLILSSEFRPLIFKLIKKIIL